MIGTSVGIRELQSKGCLALIDVLKLRRRWKCIDGGWLLVSRKMDRDIIIECVCVQRTPTHWSLIIVVIY